MIGIDSLFPYATISHAVSGLGFVLTTWLSAYLAMHVSRSFSSRLALLSLFTLSGYFLHTVLCVFVPANEIGHIWRRYLGWLALWPLPFWLHLTTSLLPKSQQSRMKLLILLTYASATVMSILWLWGPWQFSRLTILPSQLDMPIAIFAFTVGALALYNTYYLQQQAADRTLRMRFILLSAVVGLLMAWILYWPVIDILEVPWEPTPRIAVGDGIPLAAMLVLSYAVAFHNTFMSGRWVKRDFFFHAMSFGAIAVLYLFTVIGAESVALGLNLDVATLTFIAVVGLTLLTHWFAEPLRRWLDNMFFKQLSDVSNEMVGLTQDIRVSSELLETQMMALVNRLKEMTGASVVCVSVKHDNQLVVKASSESERIGRVIPSTIFKNDQMPLLKPDNLPEGQRTNSSEWDCLVFSEPILVNKEISGYLLLGERGVGEGYDREERLWISTLAAYLGVALEQAGRREETARRFTELTSEVESLAKQELTLLREFEFALAGPRCQIDQQELREAIHAYNRPDRLAELLQRDGNTLSSLVTSHSSPVTALQRRLTHAVDSIAPSADILPSLDTIQNRNVRNKRRGHLPTSVANYYTLKLIMDGHSHESIAETLEVSSRQVRNYLDRAVSSVKTVLENDNGAIKN